MPPVLTTGLHIWQTVRPDVKCSTASQDPLSLPESAHTQASIRKAMPLFIIQGDITKLTCDAIVNAANNSLLGGGGVAGAIHNAAGPGLLAECAALDGCDTGDAKITKGYDLKAKYVIHTVGPIVQGSLTKRHEELLASCYRSCLDIAEENNVESIALCCISTGVFMFPNQRAAEIAVDTVKAWLAETGSQMKVVFNVYKDLDLKIYSELLQ